MPSAKAADKHVQNNLPNPLFLSSPFTWKRNRRDLVPLVSVLSVRLLVKKGVRVTCSPGGTFRYISSHYCLSFLQQTEYASRREPKVAKTVSFPLCSSQGCYVGLPKGRGQTESCFRRAALNAAYQDNFEVSRLRQTLGTLGSCDGQRFSRLNAISADSTS